MVGVTVGLQCSVGRKGNRWDELVLICKACRSESLSSFQ